MIRGDGCGAIRSAIGSSRRADTGCAAMALVATGRVATICSVGLAEAVPVICERPDEELAIGPAAAPAAAGGVKYGADREPVCRKTALTTTMVLIVAAARMAAKSIGRCAARSQTPNSSAPPAPAARMCSVTRDLRRLGTFLHLNI